MTDEIQKVIRQGNLLGGGLGFNRCFAPLPCGCAKCREAKKKKLEEQSHEEESE